MFQKSLVIWTSVVLLKNEMKPLQIAEILLFCHLLLQVIEP